MPSKVNHFTPVRIVLRNEAISSAAKGLTAAMLEAGVMDEGGQWVTDKDVRLGMEAHRERLLKPK